MALTKLPLFYHRSLRLTAASAPVLTVSFPLSHPFFSAYMPTFVTLFAPSSHLTLLCSCLSLISSSFLHFSSTSSSPIIPQFHPRHVFLQWSKNKRSHLMFGMHGNTAWLAPDQWRSSTKIVRGRKYSHDCTSATSLM